MDKIKEISEQYRIFAECSIEEADKDVACGLASDKPDKHHKYRDSREVARSKHLLGMMEMYSIKYGDPDTRRRIMDFLENLLFGNVPFKLRGTDTPCRMTYPKWLEIKKTIIEGEFVDGQV